MMNNLKKIAEEINYLGSCKELLDKILFHWDPYIGWNPKINDDKELLSKIREHLHFDDSE